MKRESVPHSYQFAETMSQLGGDGLLLTATRRGGQLSLNQSSNVMTIGWGTIGIIWGRPIFAVLVRPSRYTYQFIEESGCFAVNVPTAEMAEYVLFCGTKSGRDVNKFEAFDIRVSPGQQVAAATIDSCPLVYECRVVQKNDVLPGTLDPSISKQFYRRGDYHRVYYGEILDTYSTVP